MPLSFITFMKTHSEAAIIRYFEIYTNKEKKKFTSFKDIGRFAVSINFKVNQLITILHYEKSPDVAKVEEALLKRGKKFIREFSQQFKSHNSLNEQSQNGTGG